MARAGVDAKEAAHALRRLTFGPFPGGVARALDGAPSFDEVVTELVERPALPFEPPMPIDGKFDENSEDVLGTYRLIWFWIARMGSDEVGLHEKMMWFWHTHFTTSAANGTFLYQWRQFRLLHTHALGNFRDLTKAMVVDASMLQFLDGLNSWIESPNENLGRELMELFTLGVGEFTEEDVRAAARSLSGRTLNPVTGVAELVPMHGPSKPDHFLGKTMVYSSDLLVDQILEQPVAATFVAGKLWRFLVGGPPDPAGVAAAATAFRSSDYEIGVLVDSIVHSKAFRASRLSRPRCGIEWLIPAARCLNVSEEYMLSKPQLLETIGQTPYYPPNVAGWPDESGWVSPASMLGRSSILREMTTNLPDLGDGGGLLDRVLDHCGLVELSEGSRQGLEKFAASTTSMDVGPRTDLIARAALMTPEFNVA